MRLVPGFVGAGHIRSWVNSPLFGQGMCRHVMQIPIRIVICKDKPTAYLKFNYRIAHSSKDGISSLFVVCKDRPTACFKLN